MQVLQIPAGVLGSAVLWGMHVSTQCGNQHMQLRSCRASFQWQTSIYSHSHVTAGLSQLRSRSSVGANMMCACCSFQQDFAPHGAAGLCVCCVLVCVPGHAACDDMGCCLLSHHILSIRRAQCSMNLGSCSHILSRSYPTTLSLRDARDASSLKRVSSPPHRMFVRLPM
jgi:hypothetical protein